VLYSIISWSHVPSASLLLCLPNLACPFVRKPSNPLLPNSFDIIKNFQSLPGLESHQKIYNWRSHVQGSIPKWLYMVVPLDNGPIFLLPNSSHPYLVTLVEGTKVGLHHLVDHLVQGEFQLL
jgi:hypothetical protein